MTIDPRLLGLIRAFQTATTRGLALFLERASLQDPFRWRAAGLPQWGALPGEPPIEYFFHGVGLRLMIGAEELDFDFGLDGRTGGFNEYWLWNFAVRRAAEFPEFQERETLRSALEVAKQAGGVFDGGDGLEYLNVDTAVASPDVDRSRIRRERRRGRG